MKLSLKNIMLNETDKRADIKTSETYKFLKFIESKNGYSISPNSYKSIFYEFNEIAVEELIKRLIKEGWLQKDYLNHLDMGIFVTDKFLKISKGS